MFELIQAGKNSYYINCPSKIGIYRVNDNEVYLIDSGNDKQVGRKIKKILDEKNWDLKGIINTHSNADHIGGNKYLQNQTGCKIFSCGIETAFINYPILESSFLYGGFPFKDLKHKFFLAEKSNAVDISDEDFPKELKPIPLKGHFFDMIGICTPDNVAFIADCVLGENIIKKYHISFIYDIEQYLETLDRVENIDASFFVPSHAEVCDSLETLKALVELNREKVYEISEKIQAILKEPMCFEDLLKKIFDYYSLTMNFEQYFLVGSTIKSYLSWLKDKGEITASFKDNRFIWSK